MKNQKETFDNIKMIAIFDLIIKSATKAPCSFSYTIPSYLYQRSVEYIAANLKIEPPIRQSISVSFRGDFCSVTFGIKKSSVKKSAPKKVKKIK
jgi:hypothetical protein